MIEGTKLFRKKNSPPEEAPPEKVSEENSVDKPASNAVNIDRRQWFGSLVPAFGEGLVKILRESNNLQSQLHEALHKKTETILQNEQGPS